ncbi:hypothetical protein [Paenibacillus agilis]|uniref:Uncharacterized protein n=1 Tax=Paenibacillus agilis TaxID=3020863 RepID=A0A559IGL6_9BACL|nr:hypothetical protein [Paenibacillus agilis]TVX86792.1 hypothetical protein FPZ44_23000 [Paenibacillus agilis]
MLTGKWTEAEKLLNNYLPDIFSSYVYIENSIREKKAGDAHYEAKHYVEAFEQYHKMHFKDSEIKKRTDELVKYPIEALMKKIRAELQDTDYCSANYMEETKLNELLEAYPKFKYVEQEVEELERNCSALSYAHDGDYDYALTKYEDEKNYAEEAVVLYILALKSKESGSISTAKNFLYRIPVDYTGQYSKEILGFKEKHVPKSEWEKQYNKHHKVALTSSQKKLFTNARKNWLAEIEQKAAESALEEDDEEDYDDDYDYNSYGNSKDKNKKSNDKKKKDKKSSKSKQTKYKQDKRSSNKSSSKSSSRSSSGGSSKSSGGSRGKR